MRLSLFARLVLGYLAIFLVVTAVSVYAILQLRRFTDTTRSILRTDTRILDHEKRLTDSLLSQIRYERKFLISRDEALYEQSVQFKADFDQAHREAVSIAGPEIGALLRAIHDDYQRYHSLLAKELDYLKANQVYPQGWYREEKDKVSERILEKLDGIRIAAQSQTYGKVRDLAEAGSRAIRIALIITIVCLIFIVAISLLITRSITGPIAVLKNKTREIARGRFAADLTLSSPPEMEELAAAFNSMCDKLRNLDKMKSDFFSSMSHELRTPLTSIKEGTGLLLDGVGGETSEKHRRLLTILAEESNRLIGLVNSLLDLSKMEAGMMTYHFEKTSLAPLIKKAVGEIVPLVEAKGLGLETEFDENLPPVRVDRERILQALRNLIGNAVKFTPNGGRVKVAARGLDGQVKVSVADTGQGVSPEQLTAIFDKFHQGSQSGARPVDGTGLGLAIAKHIITSHGGKIWAESQPEKGSTFSFVLPK